MDEWQDCAQIKKHNRSEEELKEIYSQCCARNPDFAEDYIEILFNENIDGLRDKIRKLTTRSYYQACQYCQGRPIAGLETVPVAVQSGSLWRIE